MIRRLPTSIRRKPWRTIAADEARNSEEKPYQRPDQRAGADQRENVPARREMRIAIIIAEFPIDYTLSVSIDVSPVKIDNRCAHTTGLSLGSRSSEYFNPVTPEFRSGSAPPLDA